MNEPEQNVAHTQALLDAFRRRDIEDLLGMLDPEVEIFSSPELANPGKFKGRDGYLRWIGEWLDAWETFEIEPEAIEPIGRFHVLIPVRQHGKGKDSGIEVEMRVCYVAEFHDGKVTRFQLHPDRERALEAVRWEEPG